MESLLFLAHRLPYPPNKGDKVRSFHFLAHLARRYRVFLGAFVDDDDDWRHVDALRRLCAEVHVEALRPRSQRIASAVGFLSGEALTLPYYRSRELQRWVADVARRERVARAFAFSSPMAQYALGLAGVRSFVDLVDMDSAKWGQYGSHHRWPVSAVYRREAERLLAYERDIVARAEAGIFVTREESRLFCDAAPECANRVVTISNGVDSEHFSPSTEFASPFAPAERAIVFTGAMDYWPNIDAVSWFAHDVLPEIRKHDPSARFYVVGMNPANPVRALAGDPAVTVTGRVADVRPYLAHARVVVAPLRVARGIQNKVLEAMAMAKPVVVSPAIAAGLAARPGIEVEVASDAPDFAGKVVALMDPQRADAMGARARLRMQNAYTWPASFALLDELLERGNAIVRPIAPGVKTLPQGTLAAD